MDIGDVFTWEAFPFSAEKPFKRRWFVYLGEISDGIPSYFADNLTPIEIMAPTTTTKLEYYAAGGDRDSHPYVLFSPDGNNGFESECVLDLSQSDGVIKKDVLDSYSKKGDIRTRGNIGNDKLKVIYDKICVSSGYSHKLRSNIYSNLKRVGVTGISLPSRGRLRNP